MRALLCAVTLDVGVGASRGAPALSQSLCLETLMSP